MADYQDILGRAKLVRDATAIGENTATRVGGVLVDIVDWIEELKGSIGSGSDDSGGVSQSELQAAIKNAMKGYSWWGRKFGDGTAISGNIEGVNSISFRNTAATITKLLSLDANGNLCFDGNFYATGGITALGQSSISGGGTSSGTLPYSFYVKCNGANVGSNGYDGSKGMAINLEAGNGISLSSNEDVYYTKTIIISAAGSSSGSGSIQVATIPETPNGSENWISGSKLRFYQNGSKLKIEENIQKGCVDIALPESSSGGSTSGDAQLNNMLYFYGSEATGGTPSVKGGYDNSGKIYLKFQGSGVTVSTGTTNTYGDTTIVNIPGGGGSSSSSVSWSDITGKPSTFAPSSHTHTASDITNFTSAVQAVKVSNASKADTLATARTIWGQLFNGSVNISGSMSGVDNIALSGSVNFANSLTSGTLMSFTYNGRSMIGLNANKDLFLGYGYFEDTNESTHITLYGTKTLINTYDGNSHHSFWFRDNYLSLPSDGELRIGNGKIVWDDTNKAFRMTSSNGGNCNFYCDGGITALGVQSTTTSGSDFSFRNVTADCFKAAKKDTSNILYFTKGDEDFRCYFNASNELELSCSNNLYINNAKIDPDGWIICPELFCNESGHFECDGSFLSLGDDDNNAYVVFHDSGNAYKLDMSKAISLGVFTQLSTQEQTTLGARTKKKVSA